MWGFPKLLACDILFCWPAVCRPSFLEENKAESDIVAKKIYSVLFPFMSLILIKIMYSWIWFGCTYLLSRIDSFITLKLRQQNKALYGVVEWCVCMKYEYQNIGCVQKGNQGMDTALPIYWWICSSAQNTFSVKYET